MSNVDSSSIKFKEICRNEFQFLILEHDFREATDESEVSPFGGRCGSAKYSVCFVRHDLAIQIDGAGYGSSADIAIVDRMSRSISPYHLIPSHKKIDGRVVGQAEKIAQVARVLREYGIELLKGNHEVFEVVCERLEGARQLYEERRLFGIAIQEAVAAFIVEDWQTVVRLLEPYEGALSKKMAKKLAHAKGQL